MSYLDQTSRNKPRTIAAVTILHVGLGYLIVSGLAINVIKYVPQITPTHIYEDTKTPPPRTDPPPPPRNAREDPLPQSPDPLVKSNIERVTTIDVLPQGPVKPVWSDPGPIAPPPPDPPKESLARAVEPGGGRAGWGDVGGLSARGAARRGYRHGRHQRGDRHRWPGAGLRGDQVERQRPAR
jgi:protein TonB